MYVCARARAYTQVGAAGWLALTVTDAIAASVRDTARLVDLKELYKRRAEQKWQRMAIVCSCACVCVRREGRMGLTDVYAVHQYGLCADFSNSILFVRYVRIFLLPARVNGV